MVGCPVRDAVSSVRTFTFSPLLWSAYETYQARTSAQSPTGLSVEFFATQERHFSSECGPTSVALPNCSLFVCVTLLEECDPKRSFERDCCDLLISPFRYEEMNDDMDVEEFVRSAFPENAPLEKHMSVIM